VYAEGLKEFGAEGLTDLMFLAGSYMLVSTLLNGFEVPAPDVVR